MVCVLRTHVRCAPLLPAVGTGRPTDTLDETEDGGGNSEPSSALLQACGPREPHPCLRATHRQARQVDILLDNGMPAL